MEAVGTPGEGSRRENVEERAREVVESMNNLLTSLLKTSLKRLSTNAHHAAGQSEL